MIGDIKFTGSVGDLTFYQLPTSKRIIVRKRKGPSKKDIQTKRCYEFTRYLNSEWRAVVMAGKTVRLAFHELKLMTGRHCTGRLHKLFKKIQPDDTVNEYGKRSVLISHSPQKVEGFNFSTTPFSEIFSYPLDCKIDRETGTMNLKLPMVTPGVQLNNPERYVMYRFIVGLAAVPDIIYRPKDSAYVSAVSPVPPALAEYTEWFSYKLGNDAQDIEMQLKNWVNPPSVSVMAGIAIEFGTPVSSRVVDSVKNAGGSMILKVV